jgi:hypothetical protein
VRLTGLPDKLREWGLTVVEVPGWTSRGADFPKLPSVVVCHHTGTRRSTTKDLPTERVLVDGRSDLPGPLCQVGLGYSGTVYVIAAGKANHAGKGHWNGHTVGNTDSVGIEAESPGDGTWTQAQRLAYPRVCAALHDLLGTDASLTCGHRESAEPHGRKDDPVGIDMDLLRGQVAHLLKQGPPRPHANQTTTPEGDEMTDKDWKRLEDMLDAKIDAAVTKLHGDIVIMLHGDDKGHVNSIDSIAKQVGVPQT